MLRALRGKITYANVVSTLALFVAVSTGGAYAVSKIDGSDIRKRTLTGAYFKANSIGGPVIKERSLSAVPRARNAARLGGVGLERLIERLVARCPGGTKPVSDKCIEVQPRPPAPYLAAAAECEGTDNKVHPGRSLPTHSELMTAIDDAGMQLAAGGELTNHVYPATTGGPLYALYISDDPKDEDGVGLTPSTHEGAKAFRCVADPVN